MEQLLLPVSVSEHMVFDSFYPGPNLEIYQSLQDHVEKFLWISGTKGSGKTHLLQAAFHQCIRLANKSLYIPMQEYEQLSPEILDDLDQLDLICIDDIEFILGCQAWEWAQFIGDGATLGYNHFALSPIGEEKAKGLLAKEYTKKMLEKNEGNFKIISSIFNYLFGGGR